MCIRDRHRPRVMLLAIREDIAKNKNLFALKDIWKSEDFYDCLLYTSPSPRDRTRSRMPSSA